MFKTHQAQVTRTKRLSTNRPKMRAHSRGQNLVELVLTLPLMILMMFFIIEIGRAWMTYDSAKMAVRDGAYTASIYHNAAAGLTQMTNKLNAAGLDVKSFNVQQINNRHAYEANVTVTFTPFFGGLSIPTISGSVSIIPKSFNLSYSSITDVAIY